MRSHSGRTLKAIASATALLTPLLIAAPAYADEELDAMAADLDRRNQGVCKQIALESLEDAAADPFSLPDDALTSGYAISVGAAFGIGWADLDAGAENFYLPGAYYAEANAFQNLGPLNIAGWGRAGMLGIGDFNDELQGPPFYLDAGALLVFGGPTAEASIFEMEADRSESYSTEHSYLTGRDTETTRTVVLYCKGVHAGRTTGGFAVGGVFDTWHEEPGLFLGVATLDSFRETRHSAALSELSRIGLTLYPPLPQWGVGLKMKNTMGSGSEDGAYFGVGMGVEAGAYFGGDERTDIYLLSVFDFGLLLSNVL